ncbi:MAG: hypothetical protein JXB29_12010 [Sedimentisphaerales bacterium]|nr:hypothetical protein [Sedimentisphaerales bacterium]
MNARKYWILTTLLVTVFTASSATKIFALELEPKYWGEEVEKDKLEITLATKVVSKYIWRGFDKFDDYGAVQPSINLDWFGTNLSTMVWASTPLSKGFVNDEEMDYIVAYKGSFFQDTSYATNYSVNWIYYDFPNTFSRHKDLQEGGVGFSWPGSFVLGRYSLIPSYYVAKLWPAKSNSVNSREGGWIHILALGYDVPVFGVMVEEQLIHLSSEIVYNDAMGPGNVDRNWSHIVLGISTTMKDEGVTVTTGLNYQISIENTVNDEDELWGGLSISYKF